ncbi:hypothetical protein EXN57_01250 [Clostridium botulinum]|nr:hypothetical protein [Clostridium botulinum]NFD32100.1 hypothetical protein [Clostridium botulinum]NFD58007.1 hypothetical protein [Clostridium botulinum]NFD99973.1 hypothetical protein [Clostridium botulinum]
MKLKVVFLISFIMFILGIYFSNKSNFMILIGILGGGIMGCVSAFIGYSRTNAIKDKETSS